MEIINEVKIYIKKAFSNEHTGHDYYHAIRVKSIADKIVNKEGGNKIIVDISCLLHDLIDEKIQDSLNKDCENFNDFFKKLKIKNEHKETILYIINNMSFSKMLDKNNNINFFKELQIVSDADKIDSLGAIGIARTFAYGSKVGNDIYNPEILPEINLNNEEYKKKNRKTTSLNHFDEKLLKIDQYLFTETAKQIAKPRIEFIKLFKNTFLNEWNY